MTRAAANREAWAALALRGLPYGVTLRALTYNQDLLAAAGVETPRADWTIDQGWASYTAAEHATWKTLFERQSRLLPGRVGRGVGELATARHGDGALGRRDRGAVGAAGQVGNRISSVGCRRTAGNLTAPGNGIRRCASCYGKIDGAVLTTAGVVHGRRHR